MFAKAGGLRAVAGTVARAAPTGEAKTGPVGGWLCSHWT